MTRKRISIVLSTIFTVFILVYLNPHVWAQDDPQINQAPDPIAMSITLRTISMAAEMYSIDKKVYPAKIFDLTDGDPVYLNKEYCQEIIWGYRYDCVFSQTGYTLTATPLASDPSEAPVLIMKTGGILESLKEYEKEVEKIP